MRFRAIASDYDGTLADDGRVTQETVDALRRVRASGRKLILITGRTLADLRTVFSELSLFDLFIVETEPCSLIRLSVPKNHSVLLLPRVS